MKSSRGASIRQPSSPTNASAQLVAATHKKEDTNSCVVTGILHLTTQAVGRTILFGVTGTVYVVEKSVHAVQRAFQFFLNQGRSHFEAAGIVGNLKAESGRSLNTRAIGDGGKARGIAQWHPDRFAGLKKHARATGRDWHDLDVQLEYVEIELKNREALAAYALKRANSLEAATAAFVHFERPQGYTARRPQGAHNFNGRLQYARVVAKQYAHLEARR